MEIRVPARVYRAASRTLDSVAAALLPPHHPIGHTIAGGEVTLTDLGAIGWAAIASAALIWYTANWWWPVAIFGTLFAGYVWMWPFENGR